MPILEYIQTLGNFGPGYTQTGLYTSGHFDPYMLDTEQYQSADGNKKDAIKELRKSLRTSSDPTMTSYDLIFRPPFGILNSKKPLLPKTEMILSFDRANSELSLINMEANTTHSLAGKPLPLKNVSLRARYFSSPYLRSHFATIQEKDISYIYDECAVYHKTLPQGDTIIRLANIFGGNTPKYLFAGVIDSDALLGSYEKSSTAFKRHNVIEFDLTLNGYSCQGFPLTSENDSPLMVYDKFLKTTHRDFNNACGKLMLPSDFRSFHYIYSHKFDYEASESGWVGVNLKLSEAYEDNKILGLIFVI